MASHISVVARKTADDIEVFVQPDVKMLAVFLGLVGIQRHQVGLARIVKRQGVLMEHPEMDDAIENCSKWIFRRIVL